MPDDTPPGRVGRFEVRRELGRGAMGVVFEAHDPMLHRTVALKVIRLPFAANRKERSDFERRFLTEARAAAGLSHPGIVGIHEAGRDDATGTFYLALEHLAGQLLSDRIAEKGQFEEAEGLRLAAQLARALDYAHRRGVVHRDMKPENVMVLADGQVKILDFGLAKLGASQEQTAAGQFMGTPLFASPEQALGRAVDGRTDLFALGGILYTLLAGRRPFEGETLAQVLARVTHQPPPGLRVANPAVSAGTEAIVLRALAKDPAERYSSGNAMADDLEDVLDGRPPRHLVKPGSPALERTLVVRRREEEGLPELALEPPTPARRRRRSPLRAIGLLLLLGGLAAHYRSISGPERLADVLAPLLGPLLAPPSSQRPVEPRVVRGAPPPSALSSESLSPGTALVESSKLDSSETQTPPSSEAGTGSAPAPTSQPAPVSVVDGEDPQSTRDAQAEPVADDAAPVLLPDDHEAEGEAESPAPASATPEPVPLASPSPARAAPSARPAPPAKAELAIHLEHPLTRGTVRVWLDAKLVLRSPLSSTVSKKILFFTFRNGRVRETLQVPPGRHRLRVEVKGKERVDSAQVSAEFRPGVGRRLYVRPGGSRGRLAFEWR
jgi:serine/threonine-protein kinase